MLIWYGLERLLYRLSVSAHASRFVLKGAMLFRAWGGSEFRSTKDLDLKFPAILDRSRPRIRAYPRETVVAEKFEAMVQLGMTNSRKKDYYDLWFMSRHFEFDGSTLSAALRATFDRRGTAIPKQSPVALSAEYSDDPSHARQWKAFTERVGTTAVPGLGILIDEVAEFVLPPVFAAANVQPFERRWKAPYRWQ